ncbi:NADH-quinone oxidoreductase subunit C [Streptomyces sp. NPDC021096]|uniref:NADH-quinone oxidoreductase subunit C n=1 Tax=Streptomyces sp. NPDC021096 TaxID=3154792 RepID=UPI0033ED0B52
MSEPTTPDLPEPEPQQAEPQPAVGWLPGGAAELFGEGASAEEAYGLLTVDVPAESWITALETARDRLGCTFFDWLSAVDEPGTGFRVCAHVAALPGGGNDVRRLIVRTTVPHDAPALPTAVGVYAGAAWHERETHEMFGVGFTGHPHLVPLLLPEGFEGHPLRKDFVLAARVVKAWPGAKEPGESAEGGPKRRQMLPPGVPDPNEWGPLKGQLPPAPARPARTPRAAGAAGAAGAERPVRRARSVAEGSASQATEGAAAAPRRARSVSEGSASQQGEGAAPAPSQQAEGAAPAPRRTRSASEGSASQQGEGAAPAPSQQGEGAAPAPRRARSASEGSASQQDTAGPRATGSRPAPRSTDAPWHHAVPAFDEPSTKPEAEGEPAPSRRDGDQPARRSPAAPSTPAPEAPAAPAEQAEEAAPRTGESPAAGEPGTAGEPGPAAEGGSGGEPDNDTNPAGGEPA